MSEEHYVIPVVPSEDSLLHTDGHPFCYNPSCPCHEDPTLIAHMHQAYQDGELTAQEATDYTQGRLIYRGW